MSLLRVENLAKSFGDVVANDNVCLDVAAGEVFGLLGPNGAGKTTLVKQLLGLLLPDGGAITIGSVDAIADPASARRLCSYQPQASAPVEGTSARDAIEIVGAIRGGERRAVRVRTAALLEALDLTAVADRVVPMSGGMARLTGFCMAAVVPGQVVVLDEPTNDVDPLRRRALWEQIRALADGGAAVLLVTHNVLEAERCVDRLAILAAGRVLAAGPPGLLKSQLGASLRLECTVDEAAEVPTPPAPLTRIALHGRRLLCSVEHAAVAHAVAWAQQEQADGVFTDFSLTPASLEDVYAKWVDPQPSAA
jgi:ABC-2 type transport system ATP-binding protein